MNDTAKQSVTPDFSRFLEEYPSRPGIADELLRADGSLRPVWGPLLGLLADETPDQLNARFGRGDQYLRDAGVYFRQHSGSDSTERNWPLSHIPVMIGADEWAGLAEGIVQRAQLLERIMADLYGPARLVSEGLLPADIIARNPEWLRPMVGISPKGVNFLHFVAFEVGRSPDGSWFVLGDRTQAPSGAGFALENRMATSRVFRDLYPQANVQRLAGFFRGFRDWLNGLRAHGEGRVAILTPGLHTDTYFEHAYIARYLGFLLLEASEMTVADSRLAVQTINGPEPLSVVWRRLDSRFADPLELNEDSTLGAPGMVSALRAGALTMVNCLGSGVLESRALMAFMPRLANHLLGEPLKLPNIATWWCGQPFERSVVVDNLDRMMIGSALSTRLPFDLDKETVLGSRLPGADRDAVRNWISREGASLVGQEAVSLSTTPAMIDGKLVPRPMVLRVFAARTQNGWTVMPGGYARIGRSDDPTALAMRAGGSVADVWVVSDQPVPYDTLAPVGEDASLRRMPGMLPARAADNLYWLGRYIERAENAVRFLRAYHLRLEESSAASSPLSQCLADYLSGSGLDVERPVPDGLLQLFESSLGCAGKVRDRFSIDGWNALTDLFHTAQTMARTAAPGDDAARAMSVLLRKLAGFSGLVHDNMFHFNGWRFLVMGRALERALLAAQYLGVTIDPGAPEGCLDVAVEIGDSVMAHRRRYSVETTVRSVIDLLVLDDSNPRWIRFQIDALKEHDAHLPGGRDGGPVAGAAAALLQLQTELAIAGPGDITQDRLAEIGAEVAAISDALSQRYLG